MYYTYFKLLDIFDMLFHNIQKNKLKHLWYLNSEIIQNFQL